MKITDYFITEKKSMSGNDKRTVSIHKELMKEYSANRIQRILDTCFSVNTKRHICVTPAWSRYFITKNAIFIPFTKKGTPFKIRNNTQDENLSISFWDLACLDSTDTKHVAPWLKALDTIKRVFSQSDYGCSDNRLRYYIHGDNDYLGKLNSRYIVLGSFKEGPVNVAKEKVCIYGCFLIIDSKTKHGFLMNQRYNRQVLPSIKSILSPHVPYYAHVKIQKPDIERVVNDNKYKTFIL